MADIRDNQTATSIPRRVVGRNCFDLGSEESRSNLIRRTEEMLEMVDSIEPNESDSDDGESVNYFDRYRAADHFEYVVINNTVHSLTSDHATSKLFSLLKTIFSTLCDENRSFYYDHFSQNGILFTVINNEDVFISNDQLTAKFTYNVKENKIDGIYCEEGAINIINEYLLGINRQDIIHISRNHVDLFDNYPIPEKDIEYLKFIGTIGNNIDVSQLIDKTMVPDRGHIKWGELKAIQLSKITFLLKKAEEAGFDSVTKRNIFLFFDGYNNIIIKENRTSNYYLVYDCTEDVFTKIGESSTLATIFYGKSNRTTLFLSKNDIQQIMSMYSQERSCLLNENEMEDLHEVYDGRRLRVKDFFKSKEEEIMENNIEGTERWLFAYFTHNLLTNSTENLNYIINIADSAGINTEDWNFKEIFCDDKGRIDVTDKRELNNKIFATRMPSEIIGATKPEVQKVITQEDIDYVYDLTIKTYEQFEGDFESKLSEAEEKMFHLRDEYKSSVDKMKKLRRIQDSKNGNKFYGRSALKKELLSLSKSGLFEFIGIDDDYIIFKNIDPIYLSHSFYGKRSNILIGTFLFKVRFSDFKVRVECVDKSETPYMDYKHPYLPVNGWLCFGASSSDKQSFYYHNNIKGLMLLVYDLLCSYDPSEPYRRLEFFLEIDTEVQEAQAILDRKLNDSQYDEAMKSFNEGIIETSFYQESRGAVALTSDRKILKGDDARNFLEEERSRIDEDEEESGF